MFNEKFDKSVGADQTVPRNSWNQVYSICVSISVSIIIIYMVNGFPTLTPHKDMYDDMIINNVLTARSMPVIMTHL